MAVAERWKIEACLALVKQVELDNLIIPGTKDAQSKTAKCMSSLGLLPSDVLAVLHGLTVEDYSHGPLRDDKGRPHDLWVFGKALLGTLIYVKFAIFHEGDAIVGICVSFHEPERSLAFPYREA